MQNKSLLFVVVVFNHSRNTGLPAVIFCNESCYFALHFLKCSDVTLLVWVQDSTAVLQLWSFLGEQFLKGRRSRSRVLFDLIKIEFVWVRCSNLDLMLALLQDIYERE